MDINFFAIVLAFAYVVVQHWFIMDSCCHCLVGFALVHDYICTLRGSICTASTARYFSNMFTRKGLALTHLPKCPLRRDDPHLCKHPTTSSYNKRYAPRLARSGAQSMDGLMEQLSAVVQLKSIMD